jgi:serine/threonine-protein kinase
VFELEDARVAIDHARWQRLSPLLGQALDLAPEERGPWLERLRGDDPETTAEIEALLDESRAAGEERFLERAPEGLQRATLAGQTIGAYTLEAPLGHGGMGSVWLARRSDGRYEGKVAIKFLNAALVGRAGEARFRREGSILARLADPNIARLIDAGVSATGQPYLVIELVEGKHIDRHCDDQRCDVAARLALFLDVLGAVAHAHANLIVHRDLKPSNVLVTSGGMVKLLDFGIAKLLEDELHPGEATELTRDVGRALTPEYAAPEQLLGLPVTTATDVYALGVLLYVLLGGQHPAGGGTRSSAELVKAIVESSPTRLSEAVTSAKTLDGQALQENAAKRAASPERLAHVLRGDLDNIVAKALKKNPAERYASVTAFADDIRRYLHHEPVSARADSFAYRTAKFVRRNRISVALASVAALALLAGLVGTITEAERATRQAHVAEAERGRADSQARVATEQRDFALLELNRAASMNDFNAFLLADAAPSGKPFTAGELLARAEAIVERQQNDADRADMMITIGEQYRSLDRTSDALRVLTRSYEISKTLPDRIIRSRAACRLALATMRAGEGERSEALFREGMAALLDEPQYRQEKIGCLLAGSIVASEFSRPGDALARAQAAHALLPQLRYPSTTLELQVFMEVADSYRATGDFPAAITAFKQVSARMAQLGRENTLQAAIVYNNWATTLDFAGQTLQAEELYRRSMQIESADGTDKSVSPMVLTNLSRVLIELDRLDEAQRYADRARARGLAEGNEIVIRDSSFLQARIQSRRGEVAEAAKSFEDVEARYRKTRPPECVCYASLDYEQARLAVARGDVEQALAAMDKAVALAEQKTSTPDALRYFVLRRAEVELSVNRLERARDDAERVIALTRSALGTDAHSSYLGLAYLIQGRALLASGQPAEASRALSSAAAQLRLTLGAEHPQTKLAERLAARAAAGKRS